MRHRDIEHAHVGPGGGGLFYCLPSVGGLSDHLESGMALEQQSKPPAYYVVIIR
jgi:hypothetical protein